MITDMSISKPCVTPGKMMSRTREVYPTEFRQRGGSYKVNSRGSREALCFSLILGKALYRK